jgi:myo-inositol-1(or 4)-monophosphatase
MLQTAIRAARAAGAVLAERYRRPHRVTVKGLRDILTEADLAAEEAALGVIRAECPQGLIMSEESHADWVTDPERPVWFVDPLDGTANYARGLPMFATSVGVAVGGEVRCGVVYDPLLDHLFTAERGGGACLNGARLAVSPRRDPMDCLVTLDWPRAPEARRQAAEYLARVASHVDAVRSRGCASLGLCYVAAGWADAYWQYTLSAWDVAAGVLLVEEAGGRATDLSGRPYRLEQPDWLATNGHIHEALLAYRPFGDGERPRAVPE